MKYNSLNYFRKSWCVWGMLLLCLFLSYKVEAEQWSIVLGVEHRGNEAIKVALDDLVITGKAVGILFLNDGGDVENKNLLVVGSPARNPMAGKWVKSSEIKRSDSITNQGFEISTHEVDGHKVMIVSGESLIGDVYGLYWIWDRIRVHKTLPDINTVREPAVNVRLGASWGRSGFAGRTKQTMRHALRYGTNWVSGPAILDLVPWNSEPEATVNATNREKVRELIEYAHSLGMQYYSFANEFTYHPSLLNEYGATLSPCDPAYWEALQGKFRKLFKALPELDGIELCNDDISGFWDDYKAYDILHENIECEWSYTKRFRVFVEKVHEVVVDEFDKTYFHFTWGLTSYEQHYQASVYRDIFTDTLPTKGLYLIPKITAADRWWHQPYNPTFNQTPHDTLVCFETMNYYEGSKTNIFPTFSGQYFQRGLQTFLMPEKSNLRGTATLAGVEGDSWDTTSAYIYVLWRLSWNPNESMELIARDFCAINFGEAAADAMASIYLLTPSAYKYGLHIEPISYGQFNSFYHMRVGNFPLEGYPSIDNGKEHLEFLRKIYLRCKPWETETLGDLAHGREVARQMLSTFEGIESSIADPKLARDLKNRLTMTLRLIEMNGRYVELIFAYNDYMDDSTETNHNKLQTVYDATLATREAFQAVPGYGYNLFGIEQLINNVAEALQDVHEAKKALATSPSREELDATIAAHQAKFTPILEEYKDEVVKIGHFEIKVDGRDILNVSGDTYSVDHIRWDGPHVRVADIEVPLPKAEVTVIPKDIYSRPMHPFVLQQPSAENGYTARLYLDDLPGGQDWFIFDLYYIPRTPKEVGLEVPWE